MFLLQDGHSQTTHFRIFLVVLLLTYLLRFNLQIYIGTLNPNGDMSNRKSDKVYIRYTEQISGTDTPILNCKNISEANYIGYR